MNKGDENDAVNHTIENSQLDYVIHIYHITDRKIVANKCTTYSFIWLHNESKHYFSLFGLQGTDILNEVKS